MARPASEIDTILLDIDGVLVVSWEPIPGAAEAVEALRSGGRSVRFVTNTTSRSRSDIAAALRRAGIAASDDEVLTAPLATADHLRRHHPDARCLVLSSGDVGDDLTDVRRAAPGEEVDVVVLGGAGPEFTYEALDQVPTAVMDGAALVAMHRNLLWRTSDGFRLDTGAFLLGIEAATGVTATVVGKPAPALYNAALASAGTTADRTVMVGDDLHADVFGAQEVGAIGVLVRTGKFRRSELDAAADSGRGPPDLVIDSIADLPGSFPSR